MQRLPKGDANMTVSQTFWVKTGGSTYKVIYAPAAGITPGAATINVNVTLALCTKADCSTTSGTVTRSVAWKLIHDFVSWDAGFNAPVETNPAITYFTQGQAADGLIDATTAITCAGWDPNTDSGPTGADAFSGYSIRQTTDMSDTRGPAFYVGDVLPWDWKTGKDHRQDVMNRLAPNLELNNNATPDFTIASYFNNTPWTGESFLRIPIISPVNAKDTVTAKSKSAPLVAGGATPIGASLSSFQTWYNTWRPIASAKTTGDPLYTCSKKYVLFITDGDETCNKAANDPKNPCTVAASLNSGADPVQTFILGFGVAANSSNYINCVAQGGGTTPIYPQDQAALTAALEDIFGNINEKPTAFASAAVPSVQAETADKLFLTSFFPLSPDLNTDAGFWDGHVNAFLKPLPLTAAGTPDVTRTCGSLGSNPSSCLLWDAGQVLLSQAPTEAEALGGNYKIGTAVDQRRVVYTLANMNGDIPSSIRTFTPPAGVPPSSDWADLWQGLGLTVDPLDLTASAKTATEIIRNTLKKKTANISFKDGSGGTSSFTEMYVLGDIFHSDPLFYSNPDNFLYYAADLEGNKKACTDKPSDNPGYRCYAEKHRKRRKMLVLGANDGQLHAFDAGTWDTTKKDFNNGTGTEVFSYVPRLSLPVLAKQGLTTNDTEIFSVDGTVRIDDVFLDPHHFAAAGPVAANREWRTVLIGGFREGGKIDGAGGQVPKFVSGYYALDLTDPDPVSASNVPTTTGPVAGCTNTGSLNSPSAACGTNPFPTVLWEFTDSIAGSRLDEDTAGPGKGVADLGSTWSVPTVGRIQVTENTQVVVKSVAIFGGGFDPDILNGKATNPAVGPATGNWIYIVDIETGKAIYKKAVSGGVVGDPAVVDTNQDGYLDTIYFGTTAGFLYKMDISFPEVLQNYVLPLASGKPAFTSSQTVKRVGSPILATKWDPFKIFDTGGLPIYLAPTTFFVTALNQYAVAFGTGDREDLWNRVKDGSGNEIGFTFNLMVDENFTAATSGLPKTAAKYSQIGSKSASVGVNSDFVMTPLAGNNRGWILTLQPEERVITQAFGLAGVIVFSTYTPSPLLPNPSDGNKCAYKGDSNNFVVFANNANPVAVVGGVPTRFTVVTGQFVTNPFIEQGATKNSPATNKNSEQLDSTQQGILQTLKKFYPKNTKFANYWISVSGVRSDTGYVRYATIPIGIVVKNWKEY
jgi:hypothetical protein